MWCGCLQGPCPEDGLHVFEVDAVVVEKEASVVPHGAEVVLVGQQPDGARDLAAQDASHGPVVGVRHVSPCTVDQCSLTVTGGTDNGVRAGGSGPSWRAG